MRSEAGSFRFSLDEAGRFHGESISWKDSTREAVFWHSYDVNGVEVHDFLLNPLSDEEKVLLVLKYGAPLLDKSEVMSIMAANKPLG